MKSAGNFKFKNFEKNYKTLCLGQYAKLFSQLNN